MNCGFIAEYKNVRIRPLEEKDIELLRNWRNNKVISNFLRPMTEITVQMQKDWYKKYLTDSDVIQFAIEEIGTLHRVVGSVAIYGFKGNKAEIGKIIVGDPEAKGKKIGFYSLILAMYVGYQKLGIETFYGDVHEENMPAKTNDLKAGFVVIGKHPFVNGGYELELILTKKHFEETNNFLDEIKIYQECKNEKFYIGQFGTFTKTLTQADVYNYAGISGDFNPIHINKIEADKSVFGKQVCHGMLTASLISTVIGMIMPGPGSIYLSQSLNFLKPVYYGDTITAKVSVVGIDEKEHILILKTEEFNQNQVLVVEGEAKVRVG